MRLTQSFNTRHFVAIGAVALLAALISARAQETAPAPKITLRIGTPAPAISSAIPVKGDAVKAFKPGEIYVVEFWATWCGPCKTAIPHLTELSRKHAGKVTFIGLSIWEKDVTDNAHLPSVQEFVKEMGDKMAYVVAADGSEGTLARDWMNASGRNGIPATFIVGKDGKIAWMGHPMQGLDQVLEALIAGTYNVDAAAAEALAKEDSQKDSKAGLAEIKAARLDNDYPRVVTAIDAFLAKYPTSRATLVDPKFDALLHIDEAKAFAYLKGEIEQGDLMVPGEVVWTSRIGGILRRVLDASPPVKNPDWVLLLKLNAQASEIMKDKNPGLLSSMGELYFRAGDKEKAIEYGNRTLVVLKNMMAGMDEKSKESAARYLKIYETRLESYSKDAPAHAK